MHGVLIFLVRGALECISCDCARTAILWDRTEGSCVCVCVRKRHRMGTCTRGRKAERSGRRHTASQSRRQRPMTVATHTSDHKWLCFWTGAGHHNRKCRGEERETSRAHTTSAQPAGRPRPVPREAKWPHMYPAQHPTVTPLLDVRRLLTAVDCDLCARSRSAIEYFTYRNP